MTGNKNLFTINCIDLININFSNKRYTNNLFSNGFYVNNKINSCRQAKLTLF